MDNNAPQNIENEKWFEVEESEIDLFTEKLLAYKPASLHVYNFMLESLEWNKNNEATKVKIFANSKWQASFIVSLKGPFNAIAIFSPHKNYASIESALKTILNREDGSVIFYGIEVELSQYLEGNFIFSGMQLIGNENVYDFYWIPTDVAKAIEIDCPYDMYIAKLEEIHADTVNSNWPYASENSINYIRNLIKNNETVGLFRKKDSVLLSWVLNTFCGIGMLHTPHEYRRKGYAALIMKKITSYLANLGRTPILVTLRDNHSAKSLFTNMGFIYVNTLKFVCYVIFESLNWRKNNGDTNLKIFGNSPWQGSVIVTIKGPLNAVVIFSPHKNYVSIESALKTILNWEDGPVLFFGVELELSQYLEEKFLFSGKQLIRQNVYDSFWIPTEIARALEIKCPDDMYIAKLEESHAVTVNSNWPYANANSLKLIKDLIKNNDTVGLFRKEDSDLVSWVLNTFYGIGMLHTPDEYRRKGYAALVMKKITNNLANMGRTPILLTLQNNHAAKSLFGSMGFVYVNTVKFVSIA